MCPLSGRMTPEAIYLKQAVSRDAAGPMRSCRYGSVTRGAAVSSLLDAASV